MSKEDTNWIRDLIERRALSKPVTSLERQFVVRWVYECILSPEDGSTNIDSDLQTYFPREWEQGQRKIDKRDKLKR